MLRNFLNLKLFSRYNIVLKSSVRAKYKRIWQRHFGINSKGKLLWI